MLKYLFHVNIIYWFNKAIDISLYIRGNIDATSKELCLSFMTSYRTKKIPRYEKEWFLGECYYFTLWKWRKNND